MHKKKMMSMNYVEVSKNINPFDAMLTQVLAVIVCLCVCVCAC